jgi:hypothetical protein
LTVPSIVPDDTLCADAASMPANNISATTPKVNRHRDRDALLDLQIVVIMTLLVFKTMSAQMPYLP